MKPQLPPGGRHPRTGKHAQTCPECASALHRERQYLERLRDAPIPPASEDLTARLLSLTREMAFRPPYTDPRPAPWPAARVAAFTAGSTVAAAGVLAAGIFAMAGEARPSTASASAALSQVSAQTPADGRALSAERLSGLRSEGWVCPELEAMGFHLESARATVLEGRPAVELKLSDGKHYATVTERQTDAAGIAGAREKPAEQDKNGLEILRSSPWSATYHAPGRTFTYESNLPAEQAEDAVPILQRLSERAVKGVAASASTARSTPGLTPPGTPGAEPVLERFQRGVTRIAALFGLVK